MITSTLRRNVILVVAGSSLTILTVVVAVRWKIAFEMIVVMLLAIGALTILVAEKRSMAVGLVIIVLTFVLGYRTVYLTPTLRVHPGELVVWGLMVLALVQQAISPKIGIKKIRIPLWLWIFVVFWIWGWLRGVARGQSWDMMLGELKNVALLVPLYIIVQSATSERKIWRWVSIAMFSVGAIVAALGLVELLLPQTINFLPGFFTIRNPFIDASGFRRATFSFWGTPAATFVIILSVPFSVSLWSWFTEKIGRIVIVIGTVLQVAAILIGGFRSIWVVFLIQLLILASLKGRIRIGIIVLGPIIAFLVLNPTGVISRFSTLFDAARGTATDTSAINRIDLLNNAFASIVRTPGGLGWAGSGWVHSDFLQIAANLGIIAGALFVIAYIYNASRVFSGVRRKDYTGTSKDFFITLLLAMVAVGGLLVAQGVHVLPQLILPVWFIWVLADEFSHLVTEEVSGYENLQT